MKKTTKHMNPEALFNQGLQCRNSRTFSEAIKIFESLKKDKRYGGPSKNVLGVMYWLGEGVATDLQRAQKLLLESGADGHIEAWINLGDMFFSQGVAHFSTAAKYFEKYLKRHNKKLNSANKNVKVIVPQYAIQDEYKALFHLGKIYGEETFENKDYNKACEYFHTLLKKKQYDAAVMIAELYYKQGNIQKAVEFYEYALKKPQKLEANICHNLGQIYADQELGDKTPFKTRNEELDRAIKLLERAIAGGHTDSKLDLPSAYLNRDANKYQAKARAILEQLINSRGEYANMARHHLALAIQNGKIISENPKDEIIRIVTPAAQAEYVPAMDQLGTYLSLVGNEEEKKQALYWKQRIKELNEDVEYNKNSRVFFNGYEIMDKGVDEGTVTADELQKLTLSGVMQQGKTLATKSPVALDLFRKSLQTGSMTDTIKNLQAERDQEAQSQIDEYHTQTKEKIDHTKQMRRTGQKEKVSVIASQIGQFRPRNSENLSLAMKRIGDLYAQKASDKDIFADEYDNICWIIKQATILYPNFDTKEKIHFLHGISKLHVHPSHPDVCEFLDNVYKEQRVFKSDIDTDQTASAFKSISRFGYQSEQSKQLCNTLITLCIDKANEFNTTQRCILLYALASLYADVESAPKAKHRRKNKSGKHPASWLELMKTLLLALPNSPNELNDIELSSTYYVLCYCKKFNLFGADNEFQIKFNQLFQQYVDRHRAVFPDNTITGNPSGLQTKIANCLKRYCESVLEEQPICGFPIDIVHPKFLLAVQGPSHYLYCDPKQQPVSYTPKENLHRLLIQGNENDKRPLIDIGYFEWPKEDNNQDDYEKVCYQLLELKLQSIVTLSPIHQAAQLTN